MNGAYQKELWGAISNLRSQFFISNSRAISRIPNNFLTSFHSREIFESRILQWFCGQSRILQIFESRIPRQFLSQSRIPQTKKVLSRIPRNPFGGPFNVWHRITFAIQQCTCSNYLGLFVTPVSTTCNPLVLSGVRISNALYLILCLCHLWIWQKSLLLHILEEL